MMRFTIVNRVGRRWSSSEVKGTPGALCSDNTFRRMLGTPSKSEPILQDMLGAMRFAQTCGRETAVGTVRILDSKVHDAGSPQSKGDLIVDVRAKDADASYIVEVQRRKEPFFPRRAIIYSAAEIIAQCRHTLSPDLQPVHTLAFCDYDFGPGKTGSTIGTHLSAWRDPKAAMRAPDVARAIQPFTLQPDADVLAYCNGAANEHLGAEMRARMSFVFALLPHAPLLADLSDRSPPLLRWAALVAHVHPDNIDDVPRDVRSIAAVKMLLEWLDGTRDETEMERLQAEEELAANARESEAMYYDGMAEGKAQGLAEGEAKGLAEGEAQGLAEGEAKGKLDLLSSLGVRTVAGYRAMFKADPPADLARILADP